MKTIAKKIIAAITSLALLIPSATIMAARGEGDVNVAANKDAISKVHGDGADPYGVADRVTTDGQFVGFGGEDLITVDLGQRYPITEVLISTWGKNEDSNGSNYGLGASYEMSIWVSNTNPGQYTDLSTNGGVKLNTIEEFVGEVGNYNSRYELGEEGAYRYVQLKYTGNTAGAAIYINEIEVYTTQEAASNVPTVVSVGKPVYSDFYNGWNQNFIALNDGDFSTEHWMYIASGQWGNGYCGVSSDGTITDGYFDHVINLEAKFPIEKVSVTKGNDSVDGVSVANDPNAADSDWIPLVYDSGDDAYYLDAMDAEMFGADYQFVKVEITPINHSDSERLAIVKEVSVYSTSAAAASVTPAADMVNIATGKSFTSNEPGAFGFVDDYANDGDESTYWFTYAGEPQITYDLGHAYTIENVRTKKIGNGPANGNDKGSKITKVEASNDPNFNADSTVELMGSKYRFSNAGNAESNYTSYSQNELPDEFGKYRYVRVTGYPDSQEAWMLNEVEIYTKKAETELQNVSLDSTAEFINGGAADLGSTMENLIDGDSSTWCYSAGGMAVIKLPYPMTIDQIEIDSRPGYDSLTGNFTNLGGYNVWLSLYPFEGDANLPEEPGLVTKVSNAERVDQTGNRLYHAGATVVTEVEDENRYTYVTVQCPSNGEFFIYDVRILSNDPILEDEVNVEFVGEQVKDSTITLTANYRSLEPVGMTVNLYIARYDNNQLTDFMISDDIDFTGVGGSAILEYTITEEVTAQTQFKAFIWEKDTLRPFA